MSRLPFFDQIRSKADKQFRILGIRWLHANICISWYKQHTSGALHIRMWHNRYPEATRKFYQAMSTVDGFEKTLIKRNSQCWKLLERLQYKITKFQWNTLAQYKLRCLGNVMFSDWVIGAHMKGMLVLCCDEISQTIESVNYGLTKLHCFLPFEMDLKFTKNHKAWLVDCLFSLV